MWSKANREPLSWRLSGVLAHNQKLLLPETFQQSEVNSHVTGARSGAFCNLQRPAGALLVFTIPRRHENLDLASS